jgi:hypothetical protein
VPPAGNGSGGVSGEDETLGGSEAFFDQDRAR